jgi:hypothetical protein
MSEKTKNRLLAAGGYIWRLAALAAVFIGGVIALFMGALALDDAGILSIGFMFSSGSDDGWAYPMMVIVPALAVILLSWIFYKRDIKRTLIFWGVTAIVGLLIAAPFIFDNLFGYDIELRNEHRKAAQSDYIFEYPHGASDVMANKNAIRSINLAENKFYFETADSFGYTGFFVIDYCDTPEEYAEHLNSVETQGRSYEITYTYPGGGGVTGVYIISPVGNPRHIVDIVITTADGRLLMDDATWNYK